MCSLHLQVPLETLDSLKEYFFPPYITLAHTFNAPAGWSIPSRRLKQIQFQYVLEGKAVYIVEGNRHLTERGDLIYHLPDQHHEVYTVEGEPYVCLSLVFHFGAAPAPLQQLLGDDAYLGCYKDHPIGQKLSQLVVRYNQPGLDSQMLCQGLLLQIIAELAAIRSAGPKPSPVQEKAKGKMVLIRNYIAKHYDEDIQLGDLERIAGLSRNYIIAKFRESFGMTPFDYITRMRIERAKELAIQTNLSFGEIAQQVGYADVHTLGRTFKKKTGVSLSQFVASIVTP